MLAHERVGEHVEGITEAATAAAERLRTAAWFREGETTLDDDALARDFELQRVLRTSREAGNDTGTRACSRHRICGSW